jgi:hypothetical protein
MSVLFHVRRLNPRAANAVRQQPELAIHLCDQTLDFEPSTYEQAMLRDVPAARMDAARANVAARRERYVAAQRELTAALVAGGIALDDVGGGLHLERAWWGMASMIGSAEGARVVADDVGEPIGDDLGYGPARLLSPDELSPIAPLLDAVTRDAAERAFRVQEGQDSERPDPLTDEEFETCAWQPLCALRDYVRVTSQAGAWLLKWYD